MTRILVAEDDTRLLASMVPALREAGYRVTAVSRASEAADLIRSGKFEMYILDWTFPNEKADGKELLQLVRRQPKPAGVLFLTGRGAVMDKVQILSAGADDYLVKPFHLPELVARVAAVGRRHALKYDTASVLKFDDLVLDVSTSKLFVQGTESDLNGREAQLLAYFLRRPGQPVGRLELTRDLWDAFAPDDERSNTIDVHISRCRRKLGPYRHWLRTLHGVGYLFDPFRRNGGPDELDELDVPLDQPELAETFFPGESERERHYAHEAERIKKVAEKIQQKIVKNKLKKEAGIETPPAKKASPKKKKQKSAAAGTPRKVGRPKKSNA